MAEQMTIVNVDRVFEKLAAIQDRNNDLAAQLEKAKCAEEVAKANLEREKENRRYKYLETETKWRTGRLVVLVGAAATIVLAGAEQLRGLLRPGVPMADFATYLAALVDVRQDDRRQRNLRQIWACVDEVVKVVPPKPSASAPGSVAGTSGPASAVAPASRDTRISDDDKKRLRDSCQPLITG